MQTTDVLPLPLACQELRVSQKVGYDLVTSGRLTATRGDNGRWVVTRASVERCKAELAAVGAAPVSPPELDQMAASFGPLKATIEGICRAMIAAEVGFRSLQADRAEAITNGNLALADAITETITHLRAARVSWNGSAWSLDVPGIGRATTRAAVAKVEA